MTGRKAPFSGGWTRRALLLLLTLALVASSCGGKKAGSDDKAGGGDDNETEQGVETGLEDAGEPQRGGKIVYGLEAETDGGWCLSDSQLAISGIQVAKTIYDTLTIPNSKGEYVPYLAESFEHNDAYDEWTFNLRDGVKFHNGEDLTAEVVKNNFDAYRGKYEGRSSLLFSFVFTNLESVEVVDDLTVKFNTVEPWVAFPGFVYSSGRTGIMAQEQLDDPDNCDSDLIGTGPFKLKNWTRNQSFTAVANTDYWFEAPDEKPYPYLDEIEYQPITEGQQRLNALQAGDIQAMHTSGAKEILSLRDDVEAGNANLIESNKFGEVSYIMLNAEKAPLGDINIRKALQLGIDRQLLNETISNNLPELAEGPYAPGNLGHLDTTGWPEFNPEEAKKLVDAYEAENGDINLTLSATPDPEVIRTAELVQSMAGDIGIELQLKTVDQATLINLAIGGEFDINLWRNHPGGDPDTQFVWWKSDSVVNFGNINSPEIDRLLDAGRSETDAAKRKEIYEDLNRAFTEEAWNIWMWYTPWAVGLATDVHNVLGPDLPDDGGTAFPGLATGHSVLGLWTEG
jgi:peptide/nickel transport system substrate-binding protein